MTKLGNYIRERREDLYLSRADLARELSVHKAQIQRWEDGTSRPRPETMPRLARALLSEPWLLWEFLGADLEEKP